MSGEPPASPPATLVGLDDGVEFDEFTQSPSVRHRENSGYDDHTTVHVNGDGLNDVDLSRNEEPDPTAHDFPTITEFAKALIFLKQASSTNLTRYDFTASTLKLFKFYSSPVVTVLRVFNVIVLLSLAYFERPTSIHNKPWIPAIVECINLAFLSLDLYVRYKCFGRRFIKNKWNWMKLLTIIAAYIDLFIDISMEETTYRYTRILRILYVIDFSSHTHQLFRNLVRTWLKQLAALFVVLIWIGLWALYGTILFSKESFYFDNWVDSYLNLFAAMTTVNFPDIMVPSYATSPLVTLCFFIMYMCTTFFLYLPISIAIVTKNFKEMMVEERLMKSKTKRKSELAAFSLLDSQKKGVIPEATYLAFLKTIHSSSLDGDVIQKALVDASVEILKRQELSINFSEFRRLCDTVILPLVDVDTMEVMKNAVLNPLKKADLKIPEVPVISRFVNLHKLIMNPWLEYVDTVLILINATLVCWVMIDYTPPLWAMVLDTIFLVFFVILTLTRTFILGIWAYKWNMMDLVIAVMNIIGEIMRYVLIDDISVSSTSYYHAAMLLNYARFIRLISSTHRARAMVGVLWKLIVMLGNFAALLIVLFYTFALLGVFLFHGCLTPGNDVLLNPLPNNPQNLMYNGANYYNMVTFDNFPSAMTTMFHLMVVNNWHVTAWAVFACTSRGAWFFFLIFWFTVPITMLNIIIAFVIDSLQYLYTALSDIKSDDILGTIMQQTTKSFENLLDGIFEGGDEATDAADANADEDSDKSKTVRMDPI
eukprot:TRINITY_DN1589_c0_g1_i1.p1 TRINITY_DN1589_c0_g1~~TRINITY_DN1589_c0_g1_i1.p1  ORF type:complete len:765 (-),score=182.28 TRINITY_DN1589_c0_g1_i1:98-2392(-)